MKRKYRGWAITEIQRPLNFINSNFMISTMEGSFNCIWFTVTDRGHWKPQYRKGINTQEEKVVKMFYNFSTESSFND